MPAKESLTISLRPIALFLALAFLAARPAQALTEKALYAFKDLTDGSSPSALVIDSLGNLYGTTSNGGTYGNGAVFKVTPSGKFSTLYSFSQSEPGGFFPFAGLAIDSKDNLYGTTIDGGAFFAGTVFEVTPAGVETVLHSFSCQTDGCDPQAPVTLDSEGNLYGTTVGGGSHGYGIVYKLTPAGTFTIVYNFTGPSYYLVAPLAVDGDGNIYGTTYIGGAFGFGSVFKVTPSGTETILHSFTPKARDGFYPSAGVILDSEGNIYSTTGNGGAVGVGTIFKLTSTGKETILHNFAGGADGLFPSAGVTFDKQDNLYTTTYYGGSQDLGTVIELSASGVETILHNFIDNGVDGNFPNASVVLNSAGDIFGTTAQGGSKNCTGGCGVVYEVVP